MTITTFPAAGILAIELDLDSLDMRVKLLEAESHARMRHLGQIYFIDSKASMFVLSSGEVSRLIADVRAKQNALTRSLVEPATLARIEAPAA
jgi:hypothetical protein